MIVRRTVAMIVQLVVLLPLSVLAQMQFDTSNMGSEQYSGEPSLKITSQPFRTAPALRTIAWGGQTSGEVYCIGSDSRLGKLRFICRQCNASLLANTLISDNTEDQSMQAGYPLIKLNALHRRDLNDKTLYCEAQYALRSSLTGEVPVVGVDGAVVVVEAVMHVSYMDTPVIVDALTRRRPVFASDTGNRFLVVCDRLGNGQCESTGGKQLYCEIKANPQPTEIEWTGAGGQVLANGATFTVTPSAQTDSVQCRALRPGTQDASDYRMSDAVKVIPYDRPQIIPTDFAAVRSSPPFEGNGNVVHGKGRTFRMECSAQATPKPVFFWRKRQPARDELVTNATCSNGVHGQITWELNPRQNTDGPRWVVKSECVITVDEYSKAGDYFCVACVEIGRGVFDCGQGMSLNSPGGKETINVDVVGAPEFARQPPQILATETGTKVSISYCSDPPPQADGLEWIVDDTKVKPGTTYSNYRAEMPRRNVTSNYTDCYIATLNIEPITEYDQSRSYRLRVVNQYAAVEQPFNLGDLLAGNSGVGRAGIGGWWIAFIVIVCLLFLLCFVSVAFCFMRQMMCFAPDHHKKQDTSKYISNVNGGQPAGEPTTVHRYAAHNTEYSAESTKSILKKTPLLSEEVIV